MKTKWVFVDDDTSIDLLIDEDESVDDLKEVVGEMEDPTYPCIPTDSQMNLEFSRFHRISFLDYFTAD